MVEYAAAEEDKNRLYYYYTCAERFLPPSRDAGG